MFFKKLAFDLEAKQVKSDLASKDIYLLDVRTAQEYAEGHIASAHLIPVDELVTRKQEIPTNQPIYIYCRSGQRAGSAKKQLLALGFHDVYNIGGVVQWPYDLEK